MYKVLKTPHGWYIYLFLDDGQLEPIAGPYSWRQAAYRRKKKLEQRVIHDREDTRTAPV